MSEDRSGQSAQPPACPICGKPSADRYRPFCSARCADVDLNRWLSGRYAIPAEEPPEIGEGGEKSTGSDATANRKP